MSFLDQILNKKFKLTNTDTVLTEADGRRFLHSNNTVVELDRARYGYVVDTKPDGIPALVIPGVYLGSQDCCELSVISEFGITDVLSVGVPAPVTCAVVKYKFVECLDLPDTDILNVIKNCLDFIDDAVDGRIVLVHCNAGVSRSASIVIGYLMLRRGMCYEDAYGCVKAARGCIAPNAGFRKQLSEYIAVPILN